MDIPRPGFNLENPLGVGIVGIVGTVGLVGMVGIEFCRPEPRPTTPSIWVNISSYSYLKEHKLSYTYSASQSIMIELLCLLC